uniref:Uncharacterized protein n=1 Tax=Myotis myotis TaxID=51298 RepID=A0A7J7TTL3_MYOMY|nr:hypothetical protein mMyoMyo1_008914 [Myotis myotis]
MLGQRSGPGGIFQAFPGRSSEADLAAPTSPASCWAPSVARAAGAQPHCCLRRRLTASTLHPWWAGSAADGAAALGRSPDLRRLSRWPWAPWAPPHHRGFQQLVLGFIRGPRGQQLCGTAGPSHGRGMRSGCLPPPGWPPDLRGANPSPTVATETTCLLPPPHELIWRTAIFCSFTVMEFRNIPEPRRPLFPKAACGELRVRAGVCVWPRISCVPQRAPLLCSSGLPAFSQATTPPGVPPFPPPNGTASYSTQGQGQALPPPGWPPGPHPPIPS